MGNPAFAGGYFLGYRQSFVPLPIPGTAYTPDPNDVASLLMFSASGASTLTIPNDATLALPVGAMLTACRAGTGTLAIAAGSGVTIQRAATTIASVANQWGMAALWKIAPNTWWLTGDLALA